MESIRGQVLLLELSAGILGLDVRSSDPFPPPYPFFLVTRVLESHPSSSNSYIKHVGIWLNYRFGFQRFGIRSEILHSPQALEDVAGPRHSKVEVRLSYFVSCNSGRPLLSAAEGLHPEHQIHSKSLNPVKYALGQMVAGGTHSLGVKHFPQVIPGLNPRSPVLDGQSRDTQLYAGGFCSRLLPKESRHSQSTASLSSLTTLLTPCSITNKN